MVFDLKRIIRTMTIFVVPPGKKPREGYVSLWFGVRSFGLCDSCGCIHYPPPITNPLILRLLLNRYWAAKKEEGKPKVGQRC